MTGNRRTTTHYVGDDCDPPHPSISGEATPRNDSATEAHKRTARQLVRAAALLDRTLAETIKASLALDIEAFLEDIEWPTMEVER